MVAGNPWRRTTSYRHSLAIPPASTLTWQMIKYHIFKSLPTSAQIGSNPSNSDSLPWNPSTCLPMVFLVLSVSRERWKLNVSRFWIVGNHGNSVHTVPPVFTYLSSNAVNPTGWAFLPSQGVRCVGYHFALVSYGTMDYCSHQHNTFNDKKPNPHVLYNAPQ